jgi:hypothetical protein
MLRYVPWEGDRADFVLRTQRYQADLLKHATELFRRRKYRPTGGTFAFMLNDAAPAISWSVVDWRRRRKAAYGALKTAMNPLLICAEYPKAAYEAGDELRLPLFVVNDHERGLEGPRWAWELSVGQESVARGEGKAEVPGDSVVQIGEARAGLPAPGDAKLSLWLFEGGDPVRNEYAFRVS